MALARVAPLLLVFLALDARAALSVNTEVWPDRVRPSEPIQALITVSNSGPGAEAGVTLTAPVPANVSSFNPALLSGGANCPPTVSNNGLCDANEVINWNLGTIAAFQSVTVTAAMFVTAGTAAGTVLTITGTATGGASSSATATVDGNAALMLAVDDDADPVLPGDLLTYTLTYANRGAGNVTGTTLTFPIPTGTTFVSATGGGSHAAGNVTWALGTLPSTQSGQQQVVVSVNAGAATGTALRVDAATLTGTSAVTETARAYAVTALGTPSLGLAVELNPDPVRTNEWTQGELTVTNLTGATQSNVTLLARMPVGMASFNPLLVTDGGTCTAGISNNGLCDALELGTWNLGTLLAGASVRVSVPVPIHSLTGGGRLLGLEARVIADAVHRSLRRQTIAVDADAPLTLAVEEDADPAAAGELLTYTLTYGNRGAAALTGVTLAFPVPAGATFVSATGGGTLLGGEVRWVLGALPATQSDQQQVVVSVGAGLVPGSLLVVDAAIAQGTSTLAETARATAATSIGTAALGLAVEVNPDPVRPNEWAFAEVTVTNRTAGTLSGVALLARIPLTVSSFNPLLLTQGGGCIAGLSNNGLCDATELGSWALGTLLAGGSVTVSIPLPIASTGSAGYLPTLWARVTDDASRQTVTRQTLAIDSDSPLALAVDEDADPVEPGARLTYTLSYGNRGASAITGTTLSFPLPVGTSFVSATGGGALAGNEVRWALGNLPATQSSQQQVVVAVDAGLAAGTILAVDPAILDGMGTVAETTRATAATAVAAASTLGIAIEVNPDPVRPDEWSLAQITVANRGLAALTGVVLQARMPLWMSGFNPLLLTSAGSCIHGLSANGLCDATELGNWDVGNLPAGAARTVLVPVPMVSTAPAGYLPRLWARVNDDAARQALTRQTFAIDSDGPLTLAVDEDLDPAQAGGVLTYTLTYANRGAAGITGTTLAFPVPAGASFVSATGGGTLSNGKVQWALGTLPATQSEQRQVVVAVGGGLAAGSLLVVDAALLSGTGVAEENARATAATAVGAASAPFGLAVEVNPDPARPNEWALAELTVTNRTASSLTGVVLQARIPLTIADFSPALLTGGGTCIHGLSNNGLCDATELSNWALGALPPGAARTVTVPLPVSSTAPSGYLPVLEARVNDDTTRQSVVRQTVAIDADGPLVLAIDEDLDAVLPGGQLQYTLTYGNRGTAAITGAMLSVPLPGQAALVSAAGASSTVGTVVWNLPTIPAGSGGRRRLTLSVPGALPGGSVLLASEATLRGTATVAEAARAVAATAVETSKPLALAATFGRDPTQAGAALTGELTVTNASGATLSGVVLQARVPFLVNSFNPANLTGGGTCIVGISNNGLCDSIELANWALGSLAPGASVSVSMPMTTHASMANGRLMALETRVVDDTGRTSTLTRSALVAPFVDDDGDNVAAVYDNCPFFANLTQVDTDLDLRGDLCECTDQNGDGRNTVSDIVAINLAIFNPALATPLCDGTGDGNCNVSDIVAANVEIFSPTNTSICARQPVPGP